MRRTLFILAWNTQWNVQHGYVRCDLSQYALANGLMHTHMHLYCFSGYFTTTPAVANSPVDSQSLCLGRVSTTPGNLLEFTGPPGNFCVR